MKKVVFVYIGMNEWISVVKRSSPLITRKENITAYTVLAETLVV